MLNLNICNKLNIRLIVFRRVVSIYYRVHIAVTVLCLLDC